MERYFVDIQEVSEDFYTGKKTYDWKRKKENFTTKEDALKVARRCKNPWVVVKATFDEKTFTIKEKMIEVHLHN